MKKLIVLFLVLTMLAVLVPACAQDESGEAENGAQNGTVESNGENGTEANPPVAETSGNYTDEMKLPYAVDMSPEDGADSVEREGDHPDSPYFSRLDYYNMESTDTLNHSQPLQNAAAVDRVELRRYQRADGAQLV